MENLTELVRQYKQNKNNKLLEVILKIINKDIDKRVELIYRKIKHYKVDKEDIKQELYIKLLSIIDNYNPKEPFENYLFSCLKYWKPKLSKEDTTNYESLYKIDKDTGEEIELELVDKNSMNICSNMELEEIFKKCKTILEKKICELLISNPNISQAEMAEKCKTSQSSISRTINKLQKKLKIFA